jgi:hypothetical protein
MLNRMAVEFDADKLEREKGGPGAAEGRPMPLR